MDQIYNEEGYLDDETCQKILMDFERKVSDIKHVFCSSCMCVSQRLDLVHLADGTTVCKQCNTWKTNMKDQTTTHPIWFDKENVFQYELPEELQNLREAEKLLILMVSVYIPLQHLHKGQTGCHGHVCCFAQGIGE